MKTKKLLTAKSLRERLLLDRLAQRAHARTIHNVREILEHSNLCGCCNCGRIYHVSEISQSDIITEFQGDATVWCPYCGIDAVFGDGCGIKPTEKLLDRMTEMYFN